ncbi:DNA-deoxyinosine glycosylase [Thiomonas sp. FB-6]|uniref:DNA-deoxyinosine glycosylase n=1 Tax=Thiomonas sp. FB-6 TaxID=1158291 RepID=UPI000364A7A1|nr:DNA-deoxyinosine glycosylase [Thiomonas sp. FB-6]
MPKSASAPLLRGLAPVAGPGTRLLLLGSFPSEASLAAGRYYAHPRNQFWPLLSELFGVDLRALPYEARLRELERLGLGIWDVYAACEREGSLDSSIRQARPNALAELVGGLPELQGIAHNGGESARSLRITRGLAPRVWRLPSSSPANASWSFERKVAAWREVFEACGLV